MREIKTGFVLIGFRMGSGKSSKSLFRLNYAPGQANYGKLVHYGQTPMNWNLTSDQTLIIKLPSATPAG